MNAVVTETSAVSIPSGERFRNFVWLVKRELWEHKRFYYAPLIVAGIVLLSVIYGVFHMDGANLKIDGRGIHMAGEAGDGTFRNMGAFHLAAFGAFCVPFFIVTFFVTVHYAMDTLYADRRDRSILFWKSLPVSDIETVLSKLFVASVIAPLVTLVVALTTQFVVYIVLTIGLLAHGQSVGVIWADVPFFQSLLLLVYALIVTALWYLPIWAWCMLASAWANRAVFLWAALPFAGAAFLEYQTLGTTHTGEFLRTRLSGMVETAVKVDPQMVKALGEGSNNTIGVLDVITPGAYIANPQLWIGFVITAALVAATVWLRRYREST